MHAINGRLESIILLGYKDVFGFRAEITLTSHLLLCSLDGALCSLEKCCVFSSSFAVSFPTHFALLTRLTLITAMKWIKWGTRERNSNTVFQDALLHSLSWKYDYSFLCQDLQLFAKCFKLWSWSYNKPLGQEVAHKGILSAPWRAGLLEGQSGALLCLSVRMEFIHLHVCWTYVHPADFVNSDDLVGKHGWFALLQGVWTPGGPGGSTEPPW